LNEELHLQSYSNFLLFLYGKIKKKVLLDDQFAVSIIVFNVTPAPKAAERDELRKE
jgi:hypothetical protein